MSRDGRRELAPMSTARARAGGVCVDGHRFLVVGGNVHSSCEFYDASANPPTWKPFPIDMPSVRSECGVASVGDKVYVMGGYGDYGYRDDLISIDVSGGDLSALDGRSWETLAPMNQKRNEFACASDADSDPPCIYVFGGWGEGNRRLDTAEKYNIGTNTWESLPKMPGKCYGCAAGKVGNKIYVVGGRDENGNPLSSTLVFDISTQSWASAPAVPDMKSKRVGLSVVVVDGYVVAIGGHEDADGGGSTMEILDPRQNIWVESRARTIYSTGHSTAGFLSGTKEIVFAGTKDSARSESIPFNDVISGALGVPSHSVGGRNDETKNTDDHLGYGEYADALVEVVKNIEESGGSNFAVGLMASWGVGKTKLWYLIKDRIEKDDDKPRRDEVKHGTVFDMPDGFTDVYLGFNRWYSRALGKINTTADEENQEVDCNEGEKHDTIAALFIAVSAFPTLFPILLRFVPTNQGSTQENDQLNVVKYAWRYFENKLNYLVESTESKITNCCARWCFFTIVYLLLLPFAATGLVVLLAVPFAFPVVFFHIILKDEHVQKKSKNLKVTSAEKVAAREVWNRLHGHNSNPIMLWTRLSFFSLPVLFRFVILIVYWLIVTILRLVVVCLFYAASCCFGQCLGQRILGNFKFLEKTKPHHKKHIFVDFNAWVYNGSDVLWASLVLETLKAVEAEYPSHAYKLYKLKSKLAKDLIKPGDDIWIRMNKLDHAFKRFCVRISVSLMLAIGLIAYGSIELVNKNKSTIESKHGIIGGVSVLITGSLTLLTVLCRIFANFSSFLVNPTEQLLEKAIHSTGTQGHDFSSSSGFMGQVKKEMEQLTAFLQTEPLIYRGNHRVPQLSICVDDLDRCKAETVVQVLQAVNLLLEGNGEKTFWLAIDPQVVVNAIDTDYGEHLRNSGVDGRDYLDKIIQLPFCIPRMNARNKEDLLARMFLPKSELSLNEISTRYQAFKYRMEQPHISRELDNQLKFKEILREWDCNFETIDELRETLGQVGCMVSHEKHEKEVKSIAMEFIHNLESLESQTVRNAGINRGAVENIFKYLFGHLRGASHGGSGGGEGKNKSSEDRDASLPADDADSSRFGGEDPSGSCEAAGGGSTGDIARPVDATNAGGAGGTSTDDCSCRAVDDVVINEIAPPGRRALVATNDDGSKHSLVAGPDGVSAATDTAGDAGDIAAADAAMGGGEDPPDVDEAALSGDPIEIGVAGAGEGGCTANDAGSENFPDTNPDGVTSVPHNAGDLTDNLGNRLHDEESYAAGNGGGGRGSDAGYAKGGDVPPRGPAAVADAAAEGTGATNGGGYGNGGLIVANDTIMGPEEWFWIKSMLPHLPRKGRKIKKIANVYNVSKQIVEKRLKLKGDEDQIFRRKMMKAIVLAEMWPQRMAWILQVAANALLEDGLKKRGSTKMRSVNLNELVRKQISLRELQEHAAEYNQGSIQLIFEKLPLAELYHDIVEPLMHSASNTNGFSSEEVNLEAFQFLLEEFDKELGDELFLSDIYPSEDSKGFKRKSLRPFIFNMQDYFLDKASYQISQLIIHCDANTMENWEIKWERKSDRYALRTTAVGE